jgi:hypothetical protein
VVILSALERQRLRWWRQVNVAAVEGPVGERELSSMHTFVYMASGVQNFDCDDKDFVHGFISDIPDVLAMAIVK